MTGKQLQAMLDEAAQTQVGMAEEIGISGRQMRRYCAGEAPVPRVVELAVRCLTGHQGAKRRSGK